MKDTRSKACAECKHSRSLNEESGSCLAGHRPRWYASQRNPLTGSGWRRRCGDFEEKNHVLDALYGSGAGTVGDAIIEYLGSSDCSPKTRERIWAELERLDAILQERFEETLKTPDLFGQNDKMRNPEQTQETNEN